MSERGDQVAESGLLSRWARRKQQVQRGGAVEAPEQDDLSPTAVQPRGEREEAASLAAEQERRDPRTGKLYSELTDEDLPPLESLGEEADFSAFLAPNISRALRNKALAKLFHLPKYNKTCLCAEYSGDYRNFEPLGDVVPQDMKRALAREAERLAEKARDAVVEAEGEQEPVTAGAGDETAGDGTSTGDDSAAVDGQATPRKRGV